MPETRSLLVIQHEDGCPPGWLGDRWTETGIALDVRRPYSTGTDAALPADLDGHDALVVLGGEMGANDDAEYSWLAPTKALIRSAVADGTPVLGICLGHQLMAVALGGVVERNPHGHATGLTPIASVLAADDDPLIGGLSDQHVVQWNNDVVTELPAAATVLSVAADGSPQTIRFAAEAWGVQFHPEASPEIFDGWTVDKPSASLPRADGIDVSVAADDVRAASSQLRKVGDVIADRFAERLRPSRAAGRRDEADSIA